MRPQTVYSVGKSGIQLDKIKSVMSNCLTRPVTAIYWDNISSLKSRGSFSFANDIDRASGH